MGEVNELSEGEEKLAEIIDKYELEWARWTQKKDIFLQRAMREQIR